MEDQFIGKDLSKVYELRSQYCLIGLTGRTGSGVTEFAQKFTSDFNSLGLPEILPEDIKHNNGRKYRICYNYLSHHWQQFKVLYYKDVLVLIILKYPFEQLIGFLKSRIHEASDFRLIKGKLIESSKFTNNDLEIERIEKLRGQFDLLSAKIKNAFNLSLEQKQETSLWEIYNSTEFTDFSNKFNDALKVQCKAKRIKILQTISNSFRKCGLPYCQSDDVNFENVFSIVELINKLLNGYWKSDQNNEKIIIDSLRNPLEILYFKERYSSFYMFAINMDENERKKRILEVYKDTDTCNLIEQIDNEEHSSESGQFYRQDVSSSIQKSDIHINNNNPKITDVTTKDQGEIFNFVNSQILQFLSLIFHPGLVTPSSEERCMQTAFMAKYNSGCISRQVGAVITDINFSLKAVGWNNSAEQQVPCLLRSADELSKNEDSEAFSVYEKSDEFKLVIQEYNSKLDRSNITGHNCSFCFKDYQNHIEGEKNQVHTRSLHAEENAILQISKYGGEGIFGGILFSTASPCELCSKKAYQLGIRKIYYIDPYPGIAKDQILEGGKRNPELILFSGAIGRAYHKLYEPFMSYKEELKIRTGFQFPKAEDKDLKIKALEQRIKVLEEKTNAV